MPREMGARVILAGKILLARLVGLATLATTRQVEWVKRCPDPVLRVILVDLTMLQVKAVLALGDWTLKHIKPED